MVKGKESMRSDLCAWVVGRTKQTSESDGNQLKLLGPYEVRLVGRGVTAVLNSWMISSMPPFTTARTSTENSSIQIQPDAGQVLPEIPVFNVHARTLDVTR